MEGYIPSLVGSLSYTGIRIAKSLLILICEKAPKAASIFHFPVARCFPEWASQGLLVNDSCPLLLPRAPCLLAQNLVQNKMKVFQRLTTVRFLCGTRTQKGSITDTPYTMICRTLLIGVESVVSVSGRPDIPGPGKLQISKPLWFISAML